MPGDLRSRHLEAGGHTVAAPPGSEDRTSGFIVMLRHQKGFPIPMVFGDHPWDICVFATEEEATRRAEENDLGRHFGFEVYPW